MPSETKVWTDDGLYHPCKGLHPPMCPGCTSDEDKYGTPHNKTTATVYEILVRVNQILAEFSTGNVRVNPKRDRLKEVRQFMEDRVIMLEKERHATEEVLRFLKGFKE